MEQGNYIYLEDAYNKQQLCVMLYDMNYNYGFQAMTLNNVAEIELGGNTIEEAEKSYNTSIKTLNEECAKYLNTTYATSARCIGSDPLSPHNTDEELVNLDKYGNLKWQSHGESDLDALEKIVRDLPESADFWMATKAYEKIEENSTYSDYGLLYCENGKSVWNKRSPCPISILYERYLYPSEPKPYIRKCGLRVVFTLKDNLTIDSGDGTKDNPYKLIPRK